MLAGRHLVPGPVRSITLRATSFTYPLWTRPDQRALGISRRSVKGVTICVECFRFSYEPISTLRSNLIYMIEIYDIACCATSTSLLLYEPYANESSQICPFLALRPQFESVHHQNRWLSSHSYSHESMIFSRIFGSNIF